MIGSFKDREALRTLGDRVLALEAILAAQKSEIAALRQAGERQEEEVKQLRGHLARLELQAARDVDEMRKANTAIAVSVLLKQAMAGDAPSADRAISDISAE